jgi:hypothetical protein
LCIQLRDVTRLAPLASLTNLAIEDNPLARVPHCRLFVAFHLRPLQMLGTGDPTLKSCLLSRLLIAVVGVFLVVLIAPVHLVIEYFTWFLRAH